jgi:hypothetical protein
MLTLYLLDDFLKTSIVIPTYWRGPAADGNTCEFESDFIYDQASPLDSEGTLGQTLESLSVLEGVDDFAVMVLAVPTRTELKQAVELRVQTIVAQFEYKYPIMVIGPEEIMLWRQRLAARGLYQYDHFLSLDGYANVRNMCLMAAVLSSADVAVFFEDGEVYEDPEYLRKALEFIGGNHDGSFVGGVAGCLRRQDDSLLLPATDEAWQDKWGMVSSMNQAFARIDEQPRLMKTPYANGGNMVVHRDIFEKVPFDPTIPRGEAVDYLMNARLSGYDFFLDNDLWIKQAPSSQCAPSWFQLRLDIIRFARERAKLAAARSGAGGTDSDIDPAEFEPYPGRFLHDDLHDIVFETSMEMASEYYFKGREEDASECIMNIAISKAEATVSSDPLEKYIEYQQQWQEFISIVPNAGIWHPETVSD